MRFLAIEGDYYGFAVPKVIPLFFTSLNNPLAAFISNSSNSYSES